jgi:alpha-amylase/alpha-mannosidase (GH57 family)
MISKEQKKKLNEFFPSEENLNPLVNKNEVKHLSTQLNKFYPIIIRKLSKVYKENFKITNLEIILRRCLVPMTYIFFERCIRSINYKKKIKSLDGMYRFGEFNHMIQPQNIKMLKKF